MRNTIVRRSVFIAVFWLAGSDPCSARIVIGPQAKSAAPTVTNVPTLAITNPSLTSLAPLGAPSLFPTGTLPTLQLPVLPETLAVRQQIQRAAPADLPIISIEAPAPLKSERSGKKKTPILKSLRQVVGNITRGRSRSPIGFLRHFFDAKPGGNFADEPVNATADSESQVNLPPYIKIANKEDAKYLSEIYEAALESPTARKVFRQIEEYTGNGREPVIFEFSGSDGGSFTNAWEVVRLSKNYNKDSVQKAASAMVHELVHVLQKGKDLPFMGIELEIEAFIKQLKVARELDVKWNKDDFHYGLHRSLKASVEGFIDYIHNSPGYEDSITLVRHDFTHAEQQLRHMEKVSQKVIEKTEDYYKQRELTLRLMRKLKYPEHQIKSYRGEEVLDAEETVVSHEANIHLARRDQRILRTRTGRQRYLEFTREALKEARSYRELINRTDAEGAPRKNSRLRLPAQALVDRYETLPEPLKRKEHTIKIDRHIPKTTPSPLTNIFRVTKKEDELWTRGLLDAVRQSPTGRRYLEAIERRGLRTSRDGRPWLIEFYDGSMPQGSYYFGKWDILQLNRRHQSRPPSEYAPEFVQLLSEMLYEGRLVSYALETSIESYTSAFMVARELGVSFAKSNPLHAAEKNFRKSFDHFVKWLQKSDPPTMLVENRGIEGVRASIERRRKPIAARIKKQREYLRERRATLRLMKTERINHTLQRFFRADEVVGTESELLMTQATLAIIDQDLRMLSKPSHSRFYQKYAKWATDRAREYHRAYNQK